MATEKWYTRPVFFVTDAEVSYEFYTRTLGFTEAWAYREEDRRRVLQVNRGTDCELILNQTPEKAGHSRIFVSLEADELENFKTELAQNKIPFEHTSWGYPMLAIRDPDGNELFISNVVD